jgi:DHA1 family bicyclomycin/chloramphenicol resistance-like MFS transporter
MADKGLGRRALLFLILVLSIFGPLSTDMFLSGLPKMTVDFSAPESVMNMSLYLFMLAFAISILVLGPLSDKYGRRKILLITMSIYAVASVACCLTDNVWAFIAFRIVQAFGCGGAMCTAFALIKDCFTGEEMKSALSITAALGILGPILAPVIGTVLINISGWRATFWALTAVSLLCLSMGCLLPGNLPEERHEGSVIGALSRIKVVAGDRHFVLFMVMMCVFMAGQLAYILTSSHDARKGI